MRQLACSRVLWAGSLARRRPKNTEDAASVLATPGARLLLHTNGASPQHPTSALALEPACGSPTGPEPIQSGPIGFRLPPGAILAGARAAFPMSPSPGRSRQDNTNESPSSTRSAGAPDLPCTSPHLLPAPSPILTHARPSTQLAAQLPRPASQCRDDTPSVSAASSHGFSPGSGLRLRLHFSSSAGAAATGAASGQQTVAARDATASGTSSTAAASPSPMEPSATSAASPMAGPALHSSSGAPSAPSCTAPASATASASPASSSPPPHPHTLSSHAPPPPQPWSPYTSFSPAPPSTSASSPAGAPHASSASASASSPASPASAASPAASTSSSRYSEPKDGSFAGRIVQHDGNHAVHLLVAGTSSRDYNLRMVRCHARDELLVSYAGRGGGGGGGHGGGAAADGGAEAHGGALVRGEEVPFTTFIYRQVRDLVAATFLPAGYPATTGANYVRFMWWQGVNNIAVTANSVLASTFMLYAVGLGAGSIPTAGALNWVLKDGMGQLGTLIFGKTIAHNFDVHSKTWFFLSAVMLQAAAALELLTVLLPHHFLAMGSLANTLKGLAWMAAGSTRSVFHLSFARDNNIADVTAKGTSQYIFASLVGTAGGALMCAAVGQSGAAAAACYGALAAATLGSAYMAVQVIPLATLNATRLQLLVDAFLNSISPAAAAVTAAENDKDTSMSAAAVQNGDADGVGGRRRIRILDADDDYDDEYGDVGGYGYGDGGGAQRWRRPARCTTDRCYIGPSIHEYDIMFDDSLEPRIPTPLELSPLDPPLPYLSRAADRLSPPINVGSRLEHVVDGNANLLVMLLTTYRYRHFMVLPRRGALHVLLHDRADPRDIVQAYLQACILRRRLRSEASPLPDPDEHTAELRLELQESLAAAERLTTIFMSALEANGWTIAKVVVEAQRRRAKW